MAEENNIVLTIDEIHSAKDEAALRDVVCTMPGVECVTVNALRHSLSIIGADLAREDIIERIEALGFVVY